MQVDLSTAPTQPGSRRGRCTLGPWLLGIDESQRADVLAIIYGEATYAEIGRWLTMQKLKGDTQQFVSRHNRQRDSGRPCEWCEENGLIP